MIKLEHKFLEDKNVAAIALEASSDKDLDVLDALRELLTSGQVPKAGFVSSTRLVLHYKRPPLTPNPLPTSGLGVRIQDTPFDDVGNP